MAEASHPQTPSWLVPVTIVSLILGFLVVWAFLTTPTAKSAIERGRGDYRTNISAEGNAMQKKDDEISKLRGDLTRLQNSVADRNKQVEVVNDMLQEANLVGGLTKVEGAGVTVILRDSKRRADEEFIQDSLNIHDLDVMRTVNELWASGAEAIAVNGQRITGSSYYRCEGPVIFIGRSPIASPVRIEAIGNADTLYGAVTMQGRYLDEIKSVDSDMVEVIKEKRLLLPPYSGSTQYLYAKPTVAKK